MPRPKANKDQELIAYQLHKDGYGPTAIRNKLIQEFGKENSVSSRTVASWVYVFKKTTNKLDIPFEWPLMTKNGIPWSASQYLLSLWRKFKEERKFDPTVRQVRWWWRVHCADTSLRPKSVLKISQRFVIREMAHDVLGDPFDVHDLVACLAYEGWEEHPKNKKYGLKRYRSAIRRKIIPPLRDLDQEITTLYGVAEITGDYYEIEMSVEALGGPVEDHNPWPEK